MRYAEDFLCFWAFSFTRIRVFSEREKRRKNLRNCSLLSRVTNNNRTAELWLEVSEQNTEKKSERERERTSSLLEYSHINYISKSLRLTLFLTLKIKFFQLQSNFCVNAKMGLLHKKKEFFLRLSSSHSSFVRSSFFFGNFYFKQLLFFAWKEFKF